MLFGMEPDDYDPETLERLLAPDLDEYFEKVEEGGGSLLWDELVRRGWTPPEAAGLDDVALRNALERLALDCSWLGVYFGFHEHLSDRELYAEIVRIAREEPTLMWPGDPNSGTTFHLVEDHDEQTFFRYYADEGDRELWLSSDPNLDLPAREPQPYPRPWWPSR
jgi:hypothetical protein